MITALEPSFTVAEREKFDKLSSFSFVHYWNGNTEARSMPNKVIFKGNRIYENILVKLVEGDIKQSSGELFAVYLKLGHVNLLAKDFAKALSAYQKAYNLDADRFWRDPSAYFGLGLVYFHFRAFSIAAEAFNRLLFTYPSLPISVEVHARLGFIYKNLEKFDLALKHLNIALSDKAESSFLSKSELRFHIAHCYDCAGDLERAFHEYKTLSLDQSVSLSSTLHAQILRQLGWICYRRECTADTRHQKICEAEQYLIQSRELEPSCGKTYYYLGRCYGELPERAHDAFTNYRQSIDKSEADADTWCSIGVLYQQQSQPMDALQAFICAVQLDSEHSAAWSDLGRLYEVNGQFSDALHCFKKAIKYRPAAPEALKARIRVLEKELHPSSLLIGNIRSLQPNKLPGLEEAWRLPIPAELSQRQEEFLKLKQQRYRDGSPLLAMSSILRAEEAMVSVEQRLHSNSLPLVSQDDLINVLGGTGTTVKNETTSSHDDATTSTSASGNAIPKQEQVDGDDRNSLQEEAVSSTSDLPYSFSLTAAVHVPITITAEELIDRCHKRVEKPNEFTEIFDEKVPPPMPPETPNEKIPPEKALRQTPVIIVDSRKDAHGIELQNFCYNSTIALIRGMTTTLKMDLSLFSTKSLLEIAPDHEVEIRTQYRMPTDQNVDHLGNLTWACHSVRSFTTVAKYAQYQAQSFQYSLKEEAEKLRAAGAKYCGGSCDSTTVSSKRRRVAPFDESPMPMKMIKFGTNVDLSDENKFRTQLLELNKMPAFCRLVAGCNMLTHLGHSVYGMNTVQLYMKVPGARTPGHQENNGLASVNINIGPGECEWFGVPYEYWPLIDDMLRKRGLDFLKGVWWPDIDDLLEAGIPVHRFTQKAGDLVWVGSGCVHWVQSTGWCNNVAWNVGPLTALQLQIAIFSHEWNKLHGYKSLVPLQHLCWQLARNIRFSNQKIYVIIKQMLIRSLAYCKMVADMVTAAGKSIKVHPRQKGEVSHYCSTCEIEVWNLLLVREMNGKFPVYCIQCARKADLVNFLVLQQYSFDELSSVFDHFRLYPQSKTAAIC
uniref:JmjC domain-containing protein n=2 Tax=Parascaris TaxID=6254 RepID=A0A915BGM7_PARUN